MATNVLDSPLEALALDYLSVGFLTVVHNLWTWVAVVTAAVSFWRIRAAGGGPAYLKSAVSPPPSQCDQSSCGSELVPETSVPDVSADEPPTPAAAPAPAPTSPREMEIDDVKVEFSVTKGPKFVAMYYCEDVMQDNGELSVANKWDESDEDACVNVFGCEEWWESWEPVLRMRMGEVEWYRYQDLKVHNGNVVRLWDGACTGGLKYSSGCIAW